MPKYRKRPLVIEAVQLSWRTWDDVCNLIEAHGGNAFVAYFISDDEVSDTCGEPGPRYIALPVVTSHGDQAIVRHGDWIIPDSKPGTFYPCKPDIFEATYEAVDA